MSETVKISIVGSGNLGRHIADALVKAKYSIHQVYSRSDVKAQQLADRVGAQPTNDLSELEDNQVILMAIPDNAINEVASVIGKKAHMLVHSSGSYDTQRLSEYCDQFGCLYPLQTFSQNRKVDLWNCPLFVEGANHDSLALVKSIGQSIAKTVIRSNWEDRKRLHLSGVMINNFVNHLFTLTQSFLDAHNLSMDTLHPIIQETVNKAVETNPEQAQTGPAKRGELSVIREHMEMLKSHEAVSEVYKVMSNSILEYYETDK